MTYRPANPATFWPSYRAAAQALANAGDRRGPKMLAVWHKHGRGERG